MDHFEKKRESIKVLLDMLKKSASDEVSATHDVPAMEKASKSEHPAEVKEEVKEKEAPKAHPKPVKKVEDDEDDEDSDAFSGLMSHK